MTEVGSSETVPPCALVALAAVIVRRSPSTSAAFARIWGCERTVPAPLLAVKAKPENVGAVFCSVIAAVWLMVVAPVERSVTTRS